VTDSLWFRRAVIVAAAGAIFGLAGILTVQIVRATGDLDSKLARFEIAATLPEENAAEWLMAGGCAIDPTDYSRGAIGEASVRPFSEWSPELVDSVRESLERQQGALEMLHRAATLDRSSYGIEYRHGLDAEMPDMLPLMKACRLLLAEARVAAADGDRDRALIALATTGRLVSSLESESTLLTALIGIACERMMLAAAAETLVCGQPWTADPAFVEQLAATLSAEDLRAMIRRAFEVLFLRESKAAAETSGRTGEWADAGVTAADVERATAILNGLVDVPFGTGRERFFDTEADASVGVVLVDIRVAIPRQQATLAQRQLVRAAIALRRAALADGAYPVDRAVVPELTGPDPFTGRTLAYTIREDGSAEVALVGADELLSEVVLKSAASVPPIVLPAP